MSEQNGGIGTIGQAAAAATVAASTQRRQREPRAARSNPIIDVIGQPTFVSGDGKQYKRQTGWGPNKKDHPDGGTNETAAFVYFRPFNGLQTSLKPGRIYCERFSERQADGTVKMVAEYSISVPFVTAERGDTKGKAAVDEVKALIWDGFRAWVKANGGTVAVAPQKSGGLRLDSDE